MLTLSIIGPPLSMAPMPQIQILGNKHRQETKLGLKAKLKAEPNQGLAKLGPFNLITLA